MSGQGILKYFCLILNKKNDPSEDKELPDPSGPLSCMTTCRIIFLPAQMQEGKRPELLRVAYAILIKTLLNSSKFCSSNFLICLIHQISSDFSTVKVLHYMVT